MDTSDAITQLIDKGPGIAGVVIVVLIFLRYLQKRDIAVQRIMMETKQALGANTNVLQEVHRLLIKLNGN